MVHLLGLPEIEFYVQSGIEVKNNISIRDQSTSEQFSFMKVLNFKKICEIYRSQSKTT